MAAYEYQALDGRGRQTSGVVQGDSARGVRALLRDRGLHPLEVKAVTEGSGPAGTQSARLSSAEQALILRQLASLVAAGLPVDEALATLVDQADKAAARRIVGGVRARLREGHSLSAAMATFPRAFPPLVQATVAAGEHSGTLDRILLALADYSEQREALGRKIILALVYPVILAIVAVGVVSGLLAYVVPQVTDVFASFGAALPVLTRALLAVSAFVQAYGLALLLGTVLVVVGTLLLLRLPAARATWDAAWLKVPVVGRLLRAIQAARLARTLAIMVGSAVPLLDALGIAARVVTNRPMRDAVDAATTAVREGESLSRALGRSGEFPPVMLRLIAGGEESGELGRALDKAAQISEREVATVAAVLSSVLEPVLILVVGLVVTLIVVAILLPIFQMNTLIQ